MLDTHESRGAMVDRRLEPAGLTRLLGPFGDRRGGVLGVALVLLAGAGLTLVVLSPPPVSLGMVFIVPVLLVAAEFGVRAGLLCAVGAAGMLLVWSLSSGTGSDLDGIVVRSLALVFLGWSVGRISERAARSRRLLEQVIESTSDSIYIKDLEGRYLLVNTAAAALMGRHGSEILGLSNETLLPSVDAAVREREARVVDTEAPESYETSGRYGNSGLRLLSVTKSPFRDFAGATIGTLGIARDMTAQRRLQAESTRFFDLSRDMLCTVDFDGTMHSVNGEWEQALGWSPHELRGRSIFEYMAPEDHEAAADATRAARVANAPGGQLTSRWLAKDDSWHWIDWSLRTVDDERRIYAAGRDVTQRLAAQRALADSESRYRALVHGLPGTAVLVFDHELRTEFAAGQALGAAGHDPAELLGCHVSTMFAESDGAPLTDACAAALTGVTRSFDAIFAGEGHEMWVQTCPLRGETGQIVGAMLIAQDVHDRVERERAFTEVQERFRRAFDDAPIGMAVTDLQGRFLEVNQALCAITGYQVVELCTTSFMAITHPSDVGADTEAIQAMLDGSRGGYAIEKRYIRSDGEAVWAAVNVTVVRDRSGAALHFLAQVQDVTERRRFESELRHLSDHDPLTGLYNRRRFEQELERQVAQVARYGPRGALLVLDLDHFKYVNDALGHHAGDELILSVSAILQSRLRESDILARLGGDEFAVLLPTADPNQAEQVAAHLLRAIREDACLQSDVRRAGVTTSIGVATFRGADMTGEELLIEADLAMYEAKEAGRDRFVVVAPETPPPDRLRARVSWLERIRSALEEDRFVLHAQPIRDLRTGDVRQHELLIRMIGDSDELIPPGAFLPLAERFGLAPAIDRWVSTRAIELLATDPGGSQSLEVNLSGPSLNDSELLALIEAEVARLGVDPRRLIFEITETSAVANIPLARRFAERLMRLGCRFALDDFGAGFGSFYYLKHLPFDYLKIDGEFVSGCLGSRTDQLIIESVVRIARGLGKETIAEFVSDRGLESFLRSHGVDHAQGFHVGRPVPITRLGDRVPSAS